MRLKERDAFWRILLSCLVILYVAGVFVIPVCMIKLRQSGGELIINLSLFKMVSPETVGFNIQTAAYRFKAVYLIGSAALFLTGAAMCALSAKKSLCDAALGCIASSFLLLLAAADSVYVRLSGEAGSVMKAGVSIGLVFYLLLSCLTVLVVLNIKRQPSKGFNF